MRLRLSKAGAIAPLLFLAAPISAQHGPHEHHAPTAISPSARKAAAVVDAFHAALRKGDTTAAAAMLTDDALIFEGGGAERSKAEYQKQHLPADAEFARATKSVTTARSGRSEGSWAWIATEGRTTGTYKGKAIDARTTETMILHLRSGGWRIAHIHWSSAAKR